MKRASSISTIIFISILLSTQVVAKENKNNKLWFTEPANALTKDINKGWDNDNEWLKALPIGNGIMGAMVFGGVNHERIQLNEISLWSGSMENGDNSVAPQYLDEIRKLLFAGKYKEATDLTNKTQITSGQGSGNGNGAKVPFGCFQTLGDLRMDFHSTSPYQDYYRELDLVNGVVLTRFSKDGVEFTREVFASHPDKAIIIRLSANRPEAINLELSMDRPEKFTTIALDDRLQMSGILDNGKGGDGMKYIVQAIPLIEGGKLSHKDETISIMNANSVTLIVAAKTNYKLQYPEYTNSNYIEELNSIVVKATSKTYNKLKKDHIKDFSSFMRRVNFKLGNGQNNIPTNELLLQNQICHNSQDLYPLYFQYGRYLLLSSSREGSMPANLQGIWANNIQTAWNGDYHTDINVQMNYWPAEVTNLSESHKPLMSLIESLIQPGQKTAKTQYGMNGWILHPITNVWGYTSPGEHASWGMHIGAGAWICQHLWDHYAFTLDKEHLARAYPILKESCLFYLDWLVVDPKSGKLVSGPSPSPENTFKTNDGISSQISMGPSHDQQVIYNLFNNTLKSAEVLNVNDDAFRKKLIHTLDNLSRPKIGSDGRLMEWNEEFNETDITHRHLSHLFAFYPGNEITSSSTPELAKAIEKSLEYRGDDGVGWTYGWKIALWSRLHNGNRALLLLNKQLKPRLLSDSRSESTDFYNLGGGTYYNLFNAGPPFQIDGNLGVIAGMAEMFLQSHEDFIELLPALPSEWLNGEINGLVARGSIVVDMKWKDGKLIEAFAKSKSKTDRNIKYKDKLITVNLSPGKRIDIKKLLVNQ